jgi:hypothetical protein
MPRNVIKQLKQLKKSPEAGFISASNKGVGRDSLMQAIGHQEVVQPRMNFADVFVFYRWNISQFVFMPATLTASIFVIVLGGWMTTVSAASSLPGDTLYGLKLVTERTQLSLASLEHKAVLHTEFAENRLAEVAALELSSNPEKLLYIEEALDAFASELALAEGNLRQLKEEGNLETIDIAATVDQKIIALNAAIDSSLEDNGDLPSSAADEIREITRVASNGVVDVMLETHEASLDFTASTSDMKDLFKVKLQDVRQRESIDQGRVVVIKRVALENDLEIQIQGAEREILAALAIIPGAESLAAAGGYRAAFNVLRDVESILGAAEAMIADAEIQIIQVLNETEEAPVEDALVAEATEGTKTIESTDSELVENKP